MKCGPLANNSAALIFAVLLFDASTILLNSSGVFLRKLPLVMASIYVLVKKLLLIHVHVV